MSDSISRADAIRWVKTECNPYGKPTLDYDSGLKVIEHLKKMPSELPSTEAEWIPCSERLPSEDGSYLVTSSWGKVYTAHFYSEHGRWQSNRRGLIEAWQPLPKPYKAESEEV